MAVGIKSRVFARWLAPVLALLVVMQLTACGDKEPEQRKAFIDYIQNTVMRSGAKIPTLSEDQKQKFGNYAGDYAILVGFSQQLSKSLDASLTPALDQINQIRTAQDYMSKRDTLQQSVGALNLLGQQIQSAKSQADTARTALKQPDDLKAVYNQAYDKIVTGPANALMPVIPTTASFVQDLVQVGDFLRAQGNQVAFNNNGVSSVLPSRQRSTTP
jgi:chromosome condensin MukBEF ATPase and DNA-binding subunit MukB